MSFSMILLLGTLALSVEAAQHRALAADVDVQREMQTWSMPGVTQLATAFHPLRVLPVGKSDVWTVFMTDGYQGFGEDHDYRFLASTTHSSE